MKSIAARGLNQLRSGQRSGKPRAEFLSALRQADP